MSDTHNGGCRCGAIRFEAEGEPLHVSYCHCDDCRRSTGAPMVAYVGFATGTVTFRGERPAMFVNGPVTRSFCPNCGTALAFFDRRIGGTIYFHLGSMDEPRNYKPVLHAHTKQKLPFLHVPDGLPTHEGTSVPRPRLEEDRETAS